MKHLMVFIFSLFITLQASSQIVDSSMPEPNQTLLDQCKNYFTDLRKQPDKDWEAMKRNGPLEDSYFTLNIDQGSITDAQFIDSSKPWDFAPENGFTLWCYTLRNIGQQNPDKSEEAAMCMADLDNFCADAFTQP